VVVRLHLVYRIVFGSQREPQRVQRERVPAGQMGGPKRRPKRATCVVTAVTMAAGHVTRLHAFDMGPTWGRDYSGQDYNITMWNSSASLAPNHYEAAAKLCENYCLDDPNCCAWTYCPPPSADENAFSDVDDPERCCLKSSVPPSEGAAPHWTGLPPRAIVNGSTVSQQCTYEPFPQWQTPRVHHLPACLLAGGWHDVAAALTLDDTHHVFQGCPEAGGWNQATSQDLVHWTDRGINVSVRAESYEGYTSDDSPCSGFAAVNDDGVVCAGFRQCSSTHGATGLNPDAQPWDVPLEVRCALNDDLTEWGPNQYIYPVYYYRALPYDPVRPWIDTDGRWYSALSTDGCNGTTRAMPCQAGGRLDLFVADKFDGPWTQLEVPLFETNTTLRGWDNPQYITGEFVTSNFFGNLTGDPDATGSTRVVTQNQGGATYFVGQQAGGPGSAFEAYWDKPGAVGFYDYGQLTMARTLGSDPNQVSKRGRRVLIGWFNGSPSLQSLARDLSLSPGYELLQQFVPELKMLRQRWTASSFQYEVFAQFSINTTDAHDAPFGVQVMCNDDSTACASLYLNCTGVATSNTCETGVDATSVGGDKTTGSVWLPSAGPDDQLVVQIHAIVDGGTIEAIFNNRSAFAVHVTPPNAPGTGTHTFESPGARVVNSNVWDLAAI